MEMRVQIPWLAARPPAQLLNRSPAVFLFPAPCSLLPASRSTLPALPSLLPAPRIRLFFILRFQVKIATYRKLCPAISSLIGKCAGPSGFWRPQGGKMMSRSMQWLSLTGGILILGYGIYRLLAQPQPDWTPMILGLLIVAFSISKMVKSRAEKGQSDRSREEH